jgi:hypothetical protein
LGLTLLPINFWKNLEKETLKILRAEISAMITLQAEQGQGALIDSIVDSAEYLEVFGSDVVPYARSWKKRRIIKKTVTN